MKRIFCNVITAFLLTVLLFSTIPVFAAEAEGEASEMKFDENGNFRILIIADPQDTLNPRQETIDLMNAALDETNPDLVVFTGDNIHGPDWKMKGSKSRTTKAIKQIMEPVVSRNVPYCIVFGNHDDEGGISKEYQMELYQSLGNCLSVEGENMKGCGNYNIPIQSSTGDKNVFNLWFIDSGSYNTDENISSYYDFVGTDQIEWYEKKSNELKEENGGVPMPSLLFQHIAVPEIYNLLTEVDEGTENAVEKNGKYYILDSDKTQGTMGEAPCPPDYNNGQFESWKKQGDIIAAFFGHDHVNDFSGTVDGIDMVYTPGSGFYIYGNGPEHGVRVIDINEENLSYTTELLYYKDLVGDTVYGGDYLWYDGACGHEEKVMISIAASAAGVILLGAGITIFSVIKKKRKKNKLSFE